LERGRGDASLAMKKDPSDPFVLKKGKSLQKGGKWWRKRGEREAASSIALSSDRLLFSFRRKGF